MMFEKRVFKLSFEENKIVGRAFTVQGLYIYNIVRQLLVREKIPQKTNKQIPD